MSASPSPSLEAPVAEETLPAPATAAEIDASCRLPVLFMFASAAAWLVVAGLFAFVVSLKLGTLSWMAGLNIPLFSSLASALDHAAWFNSGWMTYGRVHPAHWNAFAYGFAMQAGLAVALWLLARLGRVPLGSPLLLTFAAKLWNIGVTAGVIGILAGDNTGFEWLEMPRYASGLLFFAFVIIGGVALFNFHERRETELYPSQWYLIATLLWFPWIYSVANLMLVVIPVRGVMQSLVGWWYANNFVTLALGPLALAALFYFIPRQTGRALHSHYLALFSFWTLAAFGGWGGVPAGAPVPGWISGVSGAAAVALVVSVVAVAINLGQTGCGRFQSAEGGPALRFMVVGFASYALAGIVSAALAVPEVAVFTQNTYVSPAVKHLTMYGFVGMTLLGAIYYIVPRLTQMEWPKPAFVTGHFFALAMGVILVVATLAACGARQGAAMRDLKNYPNFQDIVIGTLNFLRVATLGDTLILLGNALFAGHLMMLLVRCCKQCCGQMCGCSSAESGVAK